MENIVKEIKLREKEAQKLIEDARKKAKQKIEKAKLDILDKNQKNNEQIKKDCDNFLDISQTEAKKETENIQSNQKEKLNELEKTDINKGIDLVVSEILSNKEI